MNSELKARFARLGQTQGTAPVSSGSIVDVTLEVADGLGNLRTIDAMRALVRRGVPLAVAKRAIETVVERGDVAVHVPIVEDILVFAADLLAAGVAMTCPTSMPTKHLEALADRVE
jgi:hypothetical protein